MKNGKLNKHEVATLLKASAILNEWCDWEDTAREKAGFNPVLDDVESDAATAAGKIQDFLWMVQQEVK